MVLTVSWFSALLIGLGIKYLLLLLSFSLATLISLGTIALFLMGFWQQAVLLFIVALILLPYFRTLIERSMGRSIPWWGWTISVIVLLTCFILLGYLDQPASVYKSPEVKARFEEIYNEKMADWPVPYKDVFVDTRYGRVHVIVSGPDDAPPMLLLHASAVSSWSWKYNIEGLSKYYKTYAIDQIGDAGKSEYTSLKHVMKDGRDQAELYTEITEKLGVSSGYVVGASEGGYIATNYALYAPERVKKLVLLGPMGYSGASRSVLRIMLAQFFPLKPIQKSTFRWSFGDDSKLEDDFYDWFHLLMSGYNPVKVAPLPFSAEERENLSVPALFVFGQNDNLVGNPGKAQMLVHDIPDVQVRTIDAGHLMSAEQPEKVDNLIVNFCRE
ncbi:MAG TPA: alpha/beta fold hydrolase [Balneolales bacterium]|nr:alpha/beta fold hydrolase [Balneolales bacterium]